MKRIILYIAVFLCFSSMSAFAEKDAKNTFKGFQLFSNCEPIYFLAEKLLPNALEISLTEDSIQNAVESRLRSTHLYGEKVLNTHLYVNVNVVGRAFSISLEFNKQVFDPFTGTAGQATTWRHGIDGTHGNDPVYILSTLSQGMDKFLAEFLRVNGEACRKKK